MRRPSPKSAVLAAFLFVGFLAGCDASWDNPEPNNELKTASERDKEQKAVAAAGGPVSSTPAPPAASPTATPAAAGDKNQAAPSETPAAATPSPEPEKK